LRPLPERDAVMATLITTAKRDDIDPQAELADVLSRIADSTTNTLQSSAQEPKADRGRAFGRKNGVRGGGPRC
jgi:hypothetical protein